MNRPVTTLFMLMSLDGKISTGDSDDLDVDKDFPHIKGVKEGLHQYYKIEQTTDLWSLNSGRVLAKIGTNEKMEEDNRSLVSFVVIDNNKLTRHGVQYMCSKSKNLVIITTNKNHPAFSIESDNIHIIRQNKLDLEKALVKLKSDFKCNRITIQTGGTLNCLFLREKLIDFVDIVVAPILIGGKTTSTLIDGLPIKNSSELSKLSALKLIDCEKLNNSYLRLRYKVL